LPMRFRMVGNVVNIVTWNRLSPLPQDKEFGLHLIPGNVNSHMWYMKIIALQASTPGAVFGLFKVTFV